MAENCSADGGAATIPFLDSVEIIFLPLKTTSRLQPIDAGIVAAMEMRYRKFHLECALDLLDEREENINAIYILAAVHAMKTMWTDL